MACGVAIKLDSQGLQWSLVPFYASVDDWTVAVLTLHISDPSSPVSGATFTLELLPPPLNTGAEFLVLQKQFDEAVRRQWKVGDRVWVSASEEEEASLSRGCNAASVGRGCNIH
jgi:hypothetical protein